MIAKSARWEVVRTDAGWHARFVAANGQIVWTTETYTRRRAAVRAIELVIAPCYGWIEGDAVVCLSSRDAWSKTNRGVAEVREVDER